MIFKFNHFKKLYESNKNYNNLIDYTYINKNATIDDIKKVCNDAIKNNFYSVCVLPEFVNYAKAFLDNEDVKICALISFPNGDLSTGNKVKETIKAISDGADEIDMVFNYKKLKKLNILTGEKYSELYNDLINDIRQVSLICHKNGVILKVIIEIEELNFHEIKLACDICIEAGADFIKTSTGYSKNINTFEEKIEKLKYMRKILPDYMKIKFSGGIRNIEQIEVILPYVDRIGTSIILNSSNK